MAEALGRVDGKGNASSPGALVELASELSRELHPARRRSRVDLSSTLDHDLGLDSLARAELLLRIERRLGRSLPEQLLTTAETLRDLWAELERTAPVATLRPRTTHKPAAGDASVLTLPEDARSLVDVLQFHADRHAQRVHLLFDEGGEPTALTYAALLEHARVIASALRQRGLQPGDRVAIMLPTCLEYFYCFFGALVAGMTPVPLYPPARIARVEEHLRRQAGILRNARARLLITTPAVERLGQLLSALVGDLAVSTPESLSSLAAVPFGSAANEVALLQYTSGSTGDPKGVVLTHANLLANIRAMGEAARVSGADVMVSWLPLYHDMGLIGAWLGSLYHGCRFVVMSPLRFLTLPARWLWAIHEHGGTLSAAPNFAYELCATKIADAEIEGLELSTWRMALNGAEPVSPGTLRRFTARFAPHGFRAEALAPVYGLAECSVGLAFPPPDRGPRIDRIDRAVLTRSGRAQPAAADDPGAIEFVGCGQALPGHEIRIVDPTARELPDRQQGELEFRGPSTTRGYADNPEPTRRLWDGDWCRSGDLAYVAAGEVYVTGRSKDLIVRAGQHIHPHEIEEAIGQLPGVRRGCVAVIGTADARAGTEGVAIIVETRETDETRRSQLRARVREVATRMLDADPDDVVLVHPHSIPKTTSGKLRRAACRAAFESGELERRAPSVAGQLFRLLESALAQRLRRAADALLVWGFSTWAWLCFAWLAPVTWMWVMIAPAIRARWWLVHAAARCACALTGTRVRLEGGDRLREAGVIVANHASYLDALALAAALPVPVRFVVKAELRELWLLRLALDRLGVHYVERSQTAASLSDARRVREVAKLDAVALLFFPEGTLTRAPGLRPFHTGAFDAAAVSGRPLVPLVIEGTRSMLRDGSWLLRPGTIDVRVGPSLCAKASDFTAVVELRDAARAWMVAHCGEPDLGA